MATTGDRANRPPHIVHREYRDTERVADHRDRTCDWGCSHRYYTDFWVFHNHIVGLDPRDPLADISGDCYAALAIDCLIHLVAYCDLLVALLGDPNLD